MSRLLRLASVLACLVALPLAAFADPMAIPGKKHKNDKHLKVTIEYLDTYGHTSVNKDGIFYHVNGYGTQKGSLLYPEAYWFDAYPLYIMGKPMTFRVHVKNLSKRPVHDLKVITVQEYLNFHGKDGADLAGDSQHEWKIKKIKGHGEWVGEATWTIAGGGMPGLNQTHAQIQRQHCHHKKIKLISDLPQAGLFCPPEVD